MMNWQSGLAGKRGVRAQPESEGMEVAQPVGAAGGEGDGDQAEDQVDANQPAYHGQLFAGGGKIAGGDRAVHAPVGREKNMEINPDHADADELHQAHVQADITHALEALEDYPVAAGRKQDHRGPDTGHEVSEG